MTDDAPLRRAKAELRAEAIERRRAAYGTALDAPDRVCRHFVSAIGVKSGVAVSGFWPMGEEIDIRPLMIELHDGGALCCLPATGPRGLPLTFRRWRPGDALVSGTFGTREPAQEAETLKPEILIVPLLAFDRDGWRLGYGGGYYDRTLAALRASGRTTAVGVAFAAQEIASVPHGPRDEPLDWIVTEAGARRMGRVAEQETE